MSLIFFPSYSLSLEYSHAVRNNSLKHYLNDNFVPGVCQGQDAPTITGQICKQVITISGHLLAMREACPQHPMDIGKK